jgi:hypothetical protein
MWFWVWLWDRTRYNRDMDRDWVPETRVGLLLHILGWLVLLAVCLPGFLRIML